MVHSYKLRKKTGGVQISKRFDDKQIARWSFIK